jgi:hypothetical protein
MLPQVPTKIGLHPISAYQDCDCSNHEILRILPTKMNLPSLYKHKNGFEAQN